MSFNEALSQDLYSSILETMSIQSINSLRLVNKQCALVTKLIRDDDGFWKRRLEVLLITTIAYIPRYKSWHNIYSYISCSEDNVNKLLIDASTDNQVDVLGVLIELGTDANSKNKAIQVAAHNGNVEIIKMLIAASADVTANKNKALQVSSSMGNAQVVKLLIEAGAGVSSEKSWPLYISSKKGHIDIVKLLLEHRACVTSDRYEPIQAASLKGYVDIVKLLIQYGADATANDNQAIKSAWLGGYSDLVKVLINAGANIGNVVKMQCELLL